MPYDYTNRDDALKRYNRARKSLQQKIRRFEKRGLQVSDEIKERAYGHKVDPSISADTLNIQAHILEETRIEDIYHSIEPVSPSLDTPQDFTDDYDEPAIPSNDSSYPVPSDYDDSDDYYETDGEDDEDDYYDNSGSLEDYGYTNYNPSLDNGEDDILADESFYSDRDDRGEVNTPQESEKVIENIKNTAANLNPEKPVDTADLERVNNEISSWQPLPHWTPSLIEVKEKDKNRASNMLDGAIASQGIKAVARNIQENAKRITDLINSILYASGSKEGNFRDGKTQVNYDLNEFAELIMGRKLTVDESSHFTDLAETNEINN